MARPSATLRASGPARVRWRRAAASRRADHGHELTGLDAKAHASEGGKRGTGERLKLLTQQLDFEHERDCSTVPRGDVFATRPLRRGILTRGVRGAILLLADGVRR